MGSTSRWLIAGFMAALASGGWPHHATAQYGVTDSLPASAIMGGRASDGFQSHGGVVGPWWSGSSPGTGAPASDGGFWFGLPGLGFGGSQGSTRGMNTFTPSVTSINGGTGTLSDSRLVPFVTGVVPVVGAGELATPVTTSAMLPPPLVFSSSLPPEQTIFVARAGLRPMPSAPLQPTTPGARERASQLIADGDLMLVTARENVAAAKAALIEYRSAIRFGNDNADIEIRQAMIHEAMGKRRDADSAIARAKRIDGRLARPLEVVPESAGGFLAPATPGLPVMAARGMAILDEMASAGPDGQVVSARPGALDWLAEAWARRWGITDPAAMLVAP